MVGRGARIAGSTAAAAQFPVAAGAAVATGQSVMHCPCFCCWALCGVAPPQLGGQGVLDADALLFLCWGCGGRGGVGRPVSAAATVLARPADSATMAGERAWELSLSLPQFRCHYAF